MKTKVRGRRPRWSGPQMESAMNSVIVEGGSIQAAARLFNIPQCTLSKYVQHRTNKKPKRGPRIGWKRSSIEDPHNTNYGNGSPVKKRRGRKRKLPLANVEPEEIAYNGNKLNNGVNEDVAKEKLLNDMNLVRLGNLGLSFKPRLCPFRDVFPGIDRNLPVEQIIGASIEIGFPAFLVTWEGSDEADLLPAELCKRKYPQPLIKFFEKHLTFPLD